MGISNQAFSSNSDWVQFKMVSVRSRKPITQEFSQCCLWWNSSNVGLVDDGPFLSSQGRSLSASCFYASLLQAIDGVMSDLEGRQSQEYEQRKSRKGGRGGGGRGGWWCWRILIITRTWMTLVVFIISRDYQQRKRGCNTRPLILARAGVFICFPLFSSLVCWVG